MADYTKMWTDLGLNLDNHDALLENLGGAYQSIFMLQEHRPEGMGYFDFVMSEAHGLRIQELRDEQEAGRKIIGSFCVFVPEELVLAAGCTSVGLCAGADFAQEEVEKVLPRNTCSLIKSFFGFKLGKVCPYMEVSDLIVGENTCDGKKKSFEIFSQMVPNFFQMDLPQNKAPMARKLLKHEYEAFVAKLEEMTGKRIGVEDLKQGIATVNAKRNALARLSKLRMANPSPISGLDALLINQIAFLDNPVRFTEKVNVLCDELELLVKENKGVKVENAPRVVISGCPMAIPNWKVPAVIEATGAVIVGEESCIGERGQRNTTDDSADTVDGLIDAVVDRYFKIDCAVFTPNQERVEHIKEMAKNTNADGVIHYGLQFCQPYIMESFSVEKSLEKDGVSVLRLETDYSQEDMGQLSTRVEAFVEIIK
ncbi:double-cubane-cluster-containing anaerobic reductase [Labilibaculum sp. K2S]|uniref:double-cubane-cluster-containing anaerobic reductase n=1 Tax=Labilibaculum sp. K2S TaxID=3056386 RepID=UPI0025A3D706|nr:double-cubane-cluster-containing anaerobic reductase [Labilibaculum sp. K2S]MDM8161618.1 double-cubane-cluster-containing anaerobic reductase [Labilibaculum sp. K2S]